MNMVKTGIILHHVDYVNVHLGNCLRRLVNNLLSFLRSVGFFSSLLGLTRLHVFWFVDWISWYLTLFWGGGEGGFTGLLGQFMSFALVWISCALGLHPLCCHLEIFYWTENCLIYVKRLLKLDLHHIIKFILWLDATSLLYWLCTVKYFIFGDICFYCSGADGWYQRGLRTSCRVTGAYIYLVCFS